MSFIKYARRGCLLVAMLPLPCSPRPAHAQSVARPMDRLELLGKDVRLLAPRAHAGLIRGQVIASDSSQLIVADEDSDTLRVPVETIQRLRVRAGVGSQLFDGLLGGIAGGLAGGALMVLYANGNRDYDGGDTVAFVIGAAPGFVVGGLTGLILGHGRFVDARIR